MRKTEIIKIQSLSDSFRKSGSPTVTQILIPRQTGHDTMEEFVENLCSFDFARDLVVNDEDKEEIDFETLDIENSNESDESEINGKDEETLTLEDSVTNETKKSTCCNY